MLRDNLACTCFFLLFLWDPPVMGFGGFQVMLLGFGDQISAASPPRCQLLSPGKWQAGSIVIRKGSSQWKRSRCTRSHNTSKVQSYQILILQTWKSKNRSQVILVSRPWKHLDSCIPKKNTSTANSNPSITAKSPIISLGYTRIIKTPGALNKKNTQDTRMSLKALWIMFRHLQPSYRMYRPSCITGMLNFNSSAFQTSGCCGGGQILGHHFIDLRQGP